MNIDQAFPSKYLKAPDLQNKAVRLKIDRIEWETLGTDRKLILYFQGTDRGLVLNKTNANRITFMHGKETDHWAGKEIELYPDMVDFQGRVVEAIRVRPPSSPPKNGNGGFVANARQSAPPAPPPPVDDSAYGAADDSDIPF